MRGSLLAVFAALTLTACGRTITDQQRGVEGQIIRDRVSEWTRHLTNQALDSLTAFHDTTAGLVVVWPGGTRSAGWEEWRLALRDEFRAIARLNLVIQDPAVRVVEWGTAVVTFRFSMDVIFETTARDVFGGYGTQVWTRDGDRAWRILVSHMSRSPVGPLSDASRL